MSVESVSPVRPRGSYEVEIAGPLPPAVRASFPHVEARSLPVRTVLTTQSEQTAELEALLDKLLSVGLTLAELHERTTDQVGRQDTRGRGR